MRVLLVEDHRAMRDMIADHLRRRGFTVDGVSRVDEAVSALAIVAYEAVILDLGLPDADGFTLLRDLRDGRGPDLPTLILTARDSIEDRVRGLDAGADDYLLKPFALPELEARLRAVLRRTGARRERVYGCGMLRFDSVSRTACVNERNIGLTRREAGVLDELIRSTGQVVIRDRLEEQLYGFDDDVSPNALEASVSRLRRKLDGAGASVTIEAVRGIGYRLREGGRG